MTRRPVNFEVVRNDFPATKTYTYLDAAEASPIPIPVTEAVCTHYRRLQQKGILGWEEWEGIKGETRKKIARFINADPEEIAFTTSASSAMNLFAEMLIGKGEVVTMRDEYPTSTIPWIHKGFKVNFVHPLDEMYPAEVVKAAIGPQTQILVTSHVQYQTGFAQDLTAIGKICKNRGLTFVVNCTQSLGALPIDVKASGVDMLCASGYKWTLSGFGVGIVYVNRKLFGRLKWPRAGGESVTNWDSLDNEHFALKADASETEVGTPAFPNIIALGAGLDYLNHLGKENIRDRIHELGDYLIRGLIRRRIKIVTPLEKKYRSGITVADVPDSKKVATELEKKRIIVSARPKGLRISVHVYNSTEDLDKFLAALDDHFLTNRMALGRSRPGPIL